MFKNYLKTALRNLWREKASTVINVSGLMVGIASSLILFLLIRHHSGFDTFHANKDRIYRVTTESDGNNGKDHTPGIPAVLPEAFRTDFPEAEEVTFTSYRSGAQITIPQRQGEPKRYEEEKGVTFAQPNFFKIFDRKVIVGNAASGLDDPNETVISRKLAIKYFGKEDAIGETLEYGKDAYKVTAIMEDAPSNTDLPFDLMLSLPTIKKEMDQKDWHGIWSDEQCYFLLKSDAKITIIESRIPAFTKKYLGENRGHQTFNMQPLSDIHFNGDYSNYNYNTISHETLLALSVIAIFLIVTACINFVNLTTAEAIKRSKEVGIRKSLGSSRAQLIFQFLGETTFVTVFSVVVAVLIAQGTLGFLNPFLDLKLAVKLSDPVMWAFLGGITVMVAVLSGLYPSLVVSAFKPALALKNKMGNRNSSGYNLRRSLVVLQFCISQFFIIGTIVLIRQMDYFQSKDLGFKKDAILTLPIPEREKPSESASKMRTLRTEVLRIAGVEKASLSNTPPSSGSVSGTDFTLEGKDTGYETQVKTIDGNYLDLFGIELVAGQNVLDLDTAQGFIVNERLAAVAGFKDAKTMVGQRMKLWGKNLPVIGVAKDFHTVSLHQPIEATALFNRIANYRSLSIKIQPTNMQETIKQIQQKWEAAYPEHIFSYKFIDEDIKEFYDNEKRMSILLSIFTSVAIFIGCLGLFGLASFMANQKTKEIGVRKVMGASVENILFIFSKEFMILIAVGFLLAAPLAWFVMNQWLNEFAYKITIGPSIFLTGIGVTTAVALITVGWKSFRAATANPVDSLKYE